MSTKFSQAPGAQPTPPVCRKGPDDPIIIIPPPDQTVLQAYVKVLGPALTPDFNFIGLVTLNPTTPPVRWTGRSTQNGDEVVILIITDPALNPAFVRIRTFRNGIFWVDAVWNNVQFSSKAPIVLPLLTKTFFPPGTIFQIKAEA